MVWFTLALDLRQRLMKIQKINRDLLVSHPAQPQGGQPHGGHPYFFFSSTNLLFTNCDSQGIYMNIDI